MREKIICMSLMLALSLSAGCASENVYKGSGAERVEEFSRTDESLDEKQLEDAGKPEYIK